MRKLIVLMIVLVVLVLSHCPESSAEEMYILSTRDGSEIIVRDYTFTDDLVEFTTGNGLPGFIKKENLVGISNMVGVPPAPADDPQTVEKINRRELLIWLGSAAVLIVLYLLFLLRVIGKRKGAGNAGGADILPGRVEKKPKTQGHLAFQYRDRTGRKSDWVIEVGSAYEKGGVLFIEGICTSTEKRRTFRADRVTGPVRDMSTGRRSRIEAIFTDAD